MLEQEIRFFVPPPVRELLRQALLEQSSAADEFSLDAVYFDTDDRTMARHASAIRLRRESGYWIQTLKFASADGMSRTEYSIWRQQKKLNLVVLAGRPGVSNLGSRKKLQRLQNRLRPQFHTRLKRLRSISRSDMLIRNGADVPSCTVEMAQDSGQLIAGKNRVEINELEIELLNGTAGAMLQLARQWQQRFGLLFDPVPKAECGDRLWRGKRRRAVRRSRSLDKQASNSALLSMQAMFDECFEHVARNAIALALGNGKPAHLHEWRVAIRRLRSVLRFFRSWIEPPPAHVRAALSDVFGATGARRDADVITTQFAPVLRARGHDLDALLNRMRAQAQDPAVLAASPAVQTLLLDLKIWRHRDMRVLPAAEGFPRLAQKRIDAWHKSLSQGVHAFESLDEKNRHLLRKRIKRLRYIVQLRGGRTEPGATLARLQDQMGASQDIQLLIKACDQHADTLRDIDSIRAWSDAHQAMADLAVHEATVQFCASFRKLSRSQ